MDDNFFLYTDRPELRSARKNLRANRLRGKSLRANISLDLRPFIPKTWAFCPQTLETSTCGGPALRAGFRAPDGLIYSFVPLFNVMMNVIYVNLIFWFNTLEQTDQESEKIFFISTDDTSVH